MIDSRYPSYTFMFVAANLIMWVWKGNILFSWWWTPFIWLMEVLAFALTIGVTAKSLAEVRKHEKPEKQKSYWP